MTFLLGLSGTVSGTSLVRTALSLQSFKCSSKTTGSCQYSECTGKVSGYSREVLILVPENATSLRVHFHGHKLYIYPEYDKNLKSMVKAFNLAPLICSRGEVVVFPESTGKCVDYDKELTDGKSFKAFFDGIHEASRSHLKDLPLHVSAHSGGGRTVARMLKAGYDPKAVTLFDAIYADFQRIEIKNWYTSGTGELNLFNTAWGEPSKHAQKLIEELTLSPLASTTKIKGQTYKVKKGTKFHFLERNEGSGKAHMNVLTETW